MHWPRDAFDTIDFYGLSLDSIQRLSTGLVANVEHRIDNAETRYGIAHFERSDRILVGGAGYGGTVALLAQAFGPDAIVAYEADPLRVLMARSNVRVRGKELDIRHGALWKSDGHDVFHSSESTWAASSLNQDFAPPPHRTYSVPLVDTQRVIDEERITALLLDVEMAELDILPNLDLERLRVVVVELHAGPQRVEYEVQRLESCGLKVKERHEAQPTVHVVAAVRRK